MMMMVMVTSHLGPYGCRQRRFRRWSSVRLCDSMTLSSTIAQGAFRSGVTTAFMAICVPQPLGSFEGCPLPFEGSASLFRLDIAMIDT